MPYLLTETSARMNARSPSLVLTAMILFASALAAPAHGQGICIRIMQQDSTLNNLVDPPGIATAPLGTLGRVDKAGAGPQTMILIPGLGFGGDVFREFMDAHADRYRMIAVTLAGFDGTPPPPSPGPETSFGDQTWTNGAVAAIEELMRKENITRPILVGHWLTGTQIALRLALKHPDEIPAVILLAGSARFVATDTTRMPLRMPIERRVAGIDRFMAPRWFKTVTRETWDDNNFLPGDYAVNPVRGLRLWREAAEPDLHVWVRYLCEFYAQDISLELGSLSVPTLVVQPGLDGIFHDPGGNYMEAYCRTSWEGAGAGNPAVRFVTLPESRVCLWFDQSEALDKEMAAFLKLVEAGKDH